jgi:hypothetical protein
MPQTGEEFERDFIFSSIRGSDRGDIKLYGILKLYTFNSVIFYIQTVLITTAFALSSNSGSRGPPRTILPKMWNR